MQYSVNKNYYQKSLKSLDYEILQCEIESFLIFISKRDKLT